MTETSGELKSLVETLGQDGTLKLIEAFGGTRVIVPARRPAAHRLLDVLGQRDFDRLCAQYRGEVVNVPLARAWRISLYAAQNLSRSEIARRAGCSENMVYIHLRGARDKASQLTFGFDR